ncbi:uncharacterized protein LOC134286217 [Aedes albopictus]|uniref:Uncharacterized protein n=1 Tax=Aedes albopictus TaxID=7160 RepID=A0ABM1YVI6_AEDAL
MALDAVPFECGRRGYKVGKRPRYHYRQSLVRAVAYVHRFVCNMCCKVKKQPANCTEWLSRDELQRAETTIFKLIQHGTFGNEIVILKRNQQFPAGEQLQLDRTSMICKLSPFLDEQDVMRMGGRIARAQQVSFDFKFPVILPARHGGTTLLVDWYHRQYKHYNAETVVNEMLQRRAGITIYRGQALRTLLVEAESIVNLRPPTYLPIDSEEQEALTSKCFLMLSTSGINQPVGGEPIEERMTARCNWDLCKQLLDRFWAR